MRYLLFLLALPMYAQFGAASQIVNGNGPPNAAQCVSSGNVGRVYARKDGAAPDTTFYICSNTGVGTYAWVLGAGGGGGGSSVANAYATSAGAVTSLAIDISTLNVVSLSQTIVQCWTGAAAPFTEVAITSLNPASLTSITANFSSTANITCRVNATGGTGATGAAGAAGAAGPAPVYTTTTYSATPTFTVSASGIQGFLITLTGNVTSSTLSTGSATVGQDIWFRICQDGTGSRTFVPPTNVLGMGTISATLSTCSYQVFRWDGANARAVAPMYTDGPPSINLPGLTSGAMTLKGPDTGGGTVTGPQGTTTLVGRDTTDTLTNKTLTSPVMTAPVLGTPASGVGTNLTGTAAGLTAGVATAVPVSAGAAPTTNGQIAYDSTNHMLHGAQSSADAKIPQFTITPVNDDCAKWVVSGSNYKLGSAGLPCGSGSGTPTAGAIAYSAPSLTLTAGTRYAPIGGGGTPSTTESDSNVASPSAGTFSKFRVNVSAAPGAGNTFVFTFRKAAADQTLTCTIADTATTCSDASNSFSVVAGDQVDVKIVSTGTIVVTPMVSWLVQFGTVGSVVNRQMTLVVVDPSSTGTKSCSVVEVAGTIVAAHLIANALPTGSNLVVDVKKVAYASYTGTASASSITASAVPTIATGDSNPRYEDTTLTGWTTSISANDVVCVAINTAPSGGATWASLTLEVQ